MDDAEGRDAVARVVSLLNELLALDPDTTWHLLARGYQCAPSVADHPEIVVRGGPDGVVVLRGLGVVNGIVGRLFGPRYRVAMCTLGDENEDITCFALRDEETGKVVSPESDSSPVEDEWVRLPSGGHLDHLAKDAPVEIRAGRHSEEFQRWMRAFGLKDRDRLRYRGRVAFIARFATPSGVEIDLDQDLIHPWQAFYARRVDLGDVRVDVAR